jgi:hypothetical protein
MYGKEFLGWIGSREISEGLREMDPKRHLGPHPEILHDSC